MIPVVELALSIRYALGDMQGVGVSDYELLEPINQAVSTLYGRLSERYVHAVLKRLAITVGEDRQYTIPSDFVRVHQVVGDRGVLIPTSMNPPAQRTYRIVGNDFYANEGTYSFEYYYIPARARTLNDEIDVSESMRSWIEQLSLAMFKKDAQRAELLLQQCENVLAGRQISHYENTTPTQVLGGRI